MRSSPRVAVRSRSASGTAAALPGCADAAQERTPCRKDEGSGMAVKTVVLGLDGADHYLINAMIADGELPNLRRLRDASAVHEVENDPGQGNVQFWTGVAIGAGPGWHGHYFYLQFDPKTYDIVMDHDFGLPDVTPFWETLDNEGYRAAVVDWYEMPVKPLTRGVVIHRWFAHEPLTHTIFYPPEIAAVAARYAGSDPIAEGFASRVRDGAGALAEFFDRLLSRIDIKASFYADQMREKDWDLYVACFSEAHNAGHYYIQHEDETHALHDPQLADVLRHPLRRCYRELDKGISKVLDAAGPAAKVFMIGGPSMGKFISANSALEEIARRVDLGWNAPHTGAEAAKQTYHSLIPHNLRRRLAPLARLVRRKVAGSDYKRRRFFAVPHNDNAGAIRINLKGREKYGVVSRGAEYDAVVAEIVEGVSSFRNPATGRSIVKRVIDVAREFDGPHRDLLPDIFIEWDRTGAYGDFTHLVSDRFGEVSLPKQARTGDHGPNGFFWAPHSNLASPARPAGVAAHILDAVRSSAPES
jgi:predicted AlkP superfamily phosphohydrolase/phosphomutase